MKKHELLTAVLFCGFLTGMLALYLLLPKESFSETEKRYLSEFPALSWKAVSSGDWGDDTETYMADHIPGRDFFVGLNAYFDLYTGRQAGKDIWRKEGRLVEAPITAGASAAANNMAALNRFAEALGQKVDFMLIPSAGWALGAEEYQDDSLISQLYSMAQGNLAPLDITGLFAGKPEYYYKTDHHWTSLGAYQGYAAYAQAAGKEPRAEGSFEKNVQGPFQGSTYSRSALWLTPGEPIELWQGSEGLTVTTSENETPHDGVFYSERLEEGDKYTVFLDGNHPLVRVKNPEQEGKLLVIRDSYSNCLGCFLAESWGEVVLADLRYYREPLSQLVSEEGFDQVLICYSIGNFMTDSNFFWLK